MNEVDQAWHEMLLYAPGGGGKMFTAQAIRRAFDQNAIVR